MTQIELQPLHPRAVKGRDFENQPGGKADTEIDVGQYLEGAGVALLQAQRPCAGLRRQRQDASAGCIDAWRGFGQGSGGELAEGAPFPAEEGEHHRAAGQLVAQIDEMASGAGEQEIGKKLAWADNALVKTLAVEGVDDLLIGGRPVRVLAAG